MEVFALYLSGGERKTSRGSWPPTQLASAQPFAEMEEPGEGISCRERVYSIWDIASQVADRCLSRGCVCVYQSAEWALVKGLTGTDLVVVQALNDHQSRK